MPCFSLNTHFPRARKRNVCTRWEVPAESRQSLLRIVSRVQAGVELSVLRRLYGRGEAEWWTVEQAVYPRWRFVSDRGWMLPQSRKRLQANDPSMFHWLYTQNTKLQLFVRFLTRKHPPPDLILWTQNCNCLCDSLQYEQSYRLSLFSSSSACITSLSCMCHLDIKWKVRENRARSYQRHKQLAATDRVQLSLVRNM